MNQEAVNLYARLAEFGELIPCRLVGVCFSPHPNQSLPADLHDEYLRLERELREVHFQTVVFLWARSVGKVIERIYTRRRDSYVVLDITAGGFPDGKVLCTDDPHQGEDDIPPLGDLIAMDIVADVIADHDVEGEGSHREWSVPAQVLNNNALVVNG